MNPFSYFLTLCTIAACSSGVQLWWMMPMPPSSAMWIAISASVTVSIGDDTRGSFRLIFFVSLLSSDTAEDGKSMRPGSSRKSLYVSPPRCLLSISSCTEIPSRRSYACSTSKALLGSMAMVKCGKFVLA